MSSLHQGFQATDQPADTEAIFGWLDRMNGSPLIQAVKRQMLEVRPVGKGITSWTWAADSGTRCSALQSW